MEKKKGGKNRSSWPYWLIIIGVLLILCGKFDIKSWKLVLIGLVLIGLVVFMLVYRWKKTRTKNNSRKKQQLTSGG